MNHFFFHDLHDDEDANAMAEINVTPLVDVMLVLLIVFMITMPVLTYTISINLPGTKIDKQEVASEEPLRLTIDGEGAYFLQDKRLTAEEFAALAEVKAKDNPDTVLVIAADKAVNYAYVITALETAQKAGIKKIGFVTEKE